MMVRVSTQDQDAAAQIAALEKAGGVNGYFKKRLVEAAGIAWSCTVYLDISERRMLLSSGNSTGGRVH